MDRRNEMHKTSRVDLPLSVRLPELVESVGRWVRRRMSPAAELALGRLSFVTGGAAVVLLATVAALQIQ